MRKLAFIGLAIALIAGVTATFAASHKTKDAGTPVTIDTFAITMLAGNLPVVEVREPF